MNVFFTINHNDWIYATVADISDLDEGRCVKYFGTGYLCLHIFVFSFYKVIHKKFN
jgi:hypothetical protein